ncbi:hypothetical protein V6N13_058496 [Hibiscus sabdariffa]
MAEQKCSGQAEQKGSLVDGPTTIFIHNIPTRILWRGLWATFAHHGDMIDTFFPKKLSRSGKKFGFVCFTSRVDAYRAISRLNGFMLFGFKVSVFFARYNDRKLFSRKVQNGNETVSHQSKKSLDYHQCNGGNDEKGVSFILS